MEGFWSCKALEENHDCESQLMMNFWSILFLFENNTQVKGPRFKAIFIILMIVLSFLKLRMRLVLPQSGHDCHCPRCSDSGHMFHKKHIM